MSKRGEKRKKNPVLEQKFNEGYIEGFKQGEGFGIQKSIAFFQSKFAGLEDVKGDRSCDDEKDQGASGN